MGGQNGQLEKHKLPQANTTHKHLLALLLYLQKL